MADIKNTQVSAALHQKQDIAKQKMVALATGSAINSSGDGAAKAAKANTLKAAIKNSTTAVENMKNASALLKSVESFMGRIEQNVLKAKELALSYDSGDGGLVKEMIAKEFNSTIAGINDISNSAMFGGKKVMMADYSHTVQVNKLGKDLESKLRFHQRTGADSTPVELSYDADNRLFKLTSLNGNGAVETVPFSGTRLTENKMISFPKSGVNVELLAGGFNPEESFNNTNNSAATINVKSMPISADDPAADIGTMKNIRLIKAISSNPESSIDTILDKDSYKELEIFGAAKNAIISLGKTLKAEGLDLSEGSYSNRRITLQSDDGQDQVILEYDWDLKDVSRTFKDFRVSQDSQTELDSLDYSAAFSRNSTNGISMSFQSGINATDKISINYASVDTYQLGLNDIDLAGDTAGVVKRLDDAIGSIGMQRAKVGMTIKDVDETKSTLEATIDQYKNTLEAIDSVDVASLTTELAEAKAQTEMSVALIGQMNQTAGQYNNLVR